MPAQEKVLVVPSAFALVVMLLAIAVAGLGLYLGLSSGAETGINLGWRLLGAGVLLLSAGMTFRRSRLVEVVGPELWIRPAPFRPRQRILLKDIIAIRRPKRTILEINVRPRGKPPQCLKVNVAEVKVQQLELFVSWLVRRVPRPAREPLSVVRVA